MGKTAVIVGATGLVGKALTQQLIQHEAFSEVHVLVRKSADFADTSKFTSHVVDFDDEGTFPEIKNVNAVFCCLGTTIKKAGSQENFSKVDLTYVVRTAAYYQQLGACHFVVVSAVGANKASSIFYNRVKGEMEEQITALQFPHTVIVRPAMLGGKRSEFRFGEWLGSIILKGIQWLFVGKLRRYKIIAADKVANAMLQHALQEAEPVVILESEAIQAY